MVPKEERREFMHVRARGVLVLGDFNPLNFSRLSLMLMLSLGDLTASDLSLP